MERISTTTTDEHNASTLTDRQTSSGTSTAQLQLPVLIALFSALPLFEAWRRTALDNVDVWWHLRTGLWMLQQHAFPHDALFSRFSGVPWIASSWAYDVILAAAYKLAGLRAIVILLTFFKMALAWISYRLARAAGAGFWMAVVLSGVTQYVVHLQATGSSLSVLFFAVELWLLIRSLRTGSLKSLYWMPLLFLVWANVHLQFVLGLVLLAFFLLAIAAEKLLGSLKFPYPGGRETALSLPLAGAIAVLSFIGTLVNPYGFGLISDFWPALYSNVQFQYVADMRAMSFRSPQDFLLMLLVMTAFLSLGRRRALDLFATAALVGGALLAFRIQRDAWAAVLPAIALTGGGFSQKGNETEAQASDSARRLDSGAVVMAVLILLVSACLIPKDPALLENMAKSFPVRACEFIRQNHLRQPLFNPFGWGGFLTWYLPEYPVSVDSRVDLYGEERLTRYFALMSGKERVDADPTFADAQTFLLERQSGIAKALTDIPALREQYQLVYSDDLAAVFLRR